MQMLGNITLNISLMIYCIWFVPQILLNFKRKNTQGLSMLMFGILTMGYLSDFMYGFGRDMQWQYRLTTMIGLCSLAVSHYQFGRYDKNNSKKKWLYTALTIFYCALFFYAIIAIQVNFYSQVFYNLVGMFANLCWFSYMLPQLVKNYLNQSTEGLSTLFIRLAIFLNICDCISAWTLEWSYPSKIGPAIILLGNIILLLQVKYYARQSKLFSALVINSQ